MGGFNLPPGVSVNDIPGNRPEDVEDDRFWEEFEKLFGERYPNYAEIVDTIERTEGLTLAAHQLEQKKILLEEIFMAHATLGREMGYNRGYAEGQTEAAMAEEHHEDRAVELGLLTQEEANKYRSAVTKVRQGEDDD